MAPQADPHGSPDELPQEGQRMGDVMLAGATRRCHRGCSVDSDRPPSTFVNPARPEPNPDDVIAAAFLARQQGGSEAWRGYLGEHPSAAAELQQRLASLQAVGLDPGRGGAPDRVGGYELVRLLGGGGMGIVYLARDAAGAEVALKLVRRELLSVEAGRARFQREVAALSRLRHPGIVQWVAHGEEHGTPWLATEYLPGASLAERLATLAASPPSARQATDLWPGRPPSVASWALAVAGMLADLAEALAHAHAHGITHRDLKPGNVRLTDAGQAVLIDFGLALPDEASTLTQSGAFVGSVHYTAPELLRAGGTAGPASDVYALGVILYEALGGRQPYQGASFDAVRSQALDADPVPLRRLHAELPRGLATVCRKAMDPDPRHRYPTANAFAADLRRVLSGEPIHGRPAPAPVLALRWLRRRPLRSALLASVLALALVVPLVVLLQQAAALRATQPLTDLFLVDELVRREAELWPAVPELVEGQEGLRGWLAAAAAVRARLPQHRSALAAVRAQGQRLSRAEAAARNESAAAALRRLQGHEHNLAVARTQRPAGHEDWIAELEVAAAGERAQLDEVYAYAFPDGALAQEHRRLASLVVGLEALPRLEQRIAQRVASVAEQAAAMADHAEAWRAAIAAIADPARSPLYRGLQLAPVFGLVPLGPDPHSGLHEFAHLASGPAARRDPTSGELVVGEDTGIVLVLLPGGRVRVGADPVAGPHFDPSAQPREAPSHEFDCAPFFCAKHELTQAQWLRFDHNRSRLKIGHVAGPGVPPLTGRHPVDGVTRDEAVRVAFRMGLVLPTSRQWEYAARGGTVGRWWTGDDPVALRRAECLGEGAGRPQPTPWAVGTGAPNPFGLCDVLGNAREWCADAPRAYGAEAPRAGDGSGSNRDGGTVRGGEYRVGPEDVGVSRRFEEPVTARGGGVRLVMGVRGA